MLRPKSNIRGTVFVNTTYHIYKIKASTRKKQIIFSLPKREIKDIGGIKGFSIMANGDRIIYSKSESLGFNHSLYSTEYLQNDPKPYLILNEDIVYPAISPKGDKIAFLTQGYYLNMADIDNPVSNRVLNKKILFDRVSWDPEGKCIVFATIDEEIFIFNVNNSSTTKIANGRLPCWSPDGKKIAYASKDGYYVIDIDGKNKTLIYTYPYFLKGGSGGLAWSPDGNYIAIFRRFNFATRVCYVISLDTTKKEIEIGRFSYSIVQISWKK